MTLKQRGKELVPTGRKMGPYQTVTSQQAAFHKATVYYSILTQEINTSPSSFIPVACPILITEAE